jgi:hypothetical protein
MGHLSSMQHPNYIPGTNPFHLSGPPSWFLKGLWDFDSSLVIVPSRQTCVYRLAQRRKLQLPDHIVHDALFKESDTKMLASYGLVPVTTIIATCSWSPWMFQELHERSVHRLGGHEKVNKRQDDFERDAELKLLAQQDATNTYLAKEGWKQYRKRIGLGRTLFV